jgi:hypothetical protein
LGFKSTGNFVLQTGPCNFLYLHISPRGKPFLFLLCSLSLTYPLLASLVLAAFPSLCGSFSPHAALQGGVGALLQVSGRQQAAAARGRSEQAGPARAAARHARHAARMTRERGDRSGARLDRQQGARGSGGSARRGRSARRPEQALAAQDGAGRRRNSRACGG